MQWVAESCLHESIIIDPAMITLLQCKIVRLKKHIHSLRHPNYDIFLYSSTSVYTGISPVFNGCRAARGSSESLTTCGRYQRDETASLDVSETEKGTSEKRKCCQFDEISVTGCIGRCRFDNFKCSQWRKVRQNKNISVSIFTALFVRVNFPDLIYILSVFQIWKAISCGIITYITTGIELCNSLVCMYMSGSIYGHFI